MDLTKKNLRNKKKKGSKRAGYVLELLDKKDNVISTLLLTNNLVNILASSLATAFFYDIFGVEGIFYATLIMTVVIVIFAAKTLNDIISATKKVAISFRDNFIFPPT